MQDYTFISLSTDDQFPTARRRAGQATPSPTPSPPPAVHVYHITGYRGEEGIQPYVQYFTCERRTPDYVVLQYYDAQLKRAPNTHRTLLAGTDPPQVK